MKKTIGAVIGVGLLLLSGCATIGEQKRIYKTELRLERAIEFRPVRLPTGAPTDHPCIRGDYYHVYETDEGCWGREVYLCCVPIEEILSDSFYCAGEAFSLVCGGEDYRKIRNCYLQHPTELEPTFIPVCIPAPLTAPRNATIHEP